MLRTSGTSPDIGPRTLRAPGAAYDRLAHELVRACPAGRAARARGRACPRALRAVGQRAGGGLVIEGEAGDGEVAAARGGGRRASASASWRRGRQSSSKGSRSGSCGSSSSAHCWRPKATSATVGWREQRRWLRTCSPERRRRRRGRRRQAQPPAIPATRGNTACTGSPPTSPLIRRTHNEPTASGRPDHGASGAARCPGAQDRQIRTSVRGSTSPVLAGVLPRHTSPCRRAISDACESNLRPSPYLQKVSGSNDHKKPANSCFKCTPAEDRIRQSAISPQLRRRTSRLRTQKGLQMQAFLRAADGIRTHDLLHGKQNPRRR